MAAATIDPITLNPGETLDLSSTDIEQVKIDSKYCVTEDIHDGNVQLSIARKLPPVEGRMHSPLYDPIAIVCSGPSLAADIDEIRKFSKILTCSGAHDFLLDHGITPTWHMEADPRRHKAKFLTRPHKDVQYLIASCCHSAVFDALSGFDIRIWHVLAGERRRPIFASYPQGHWMITGGSNVGMRALVLARVMGYTNQHVFGMDCSADSHAFHVGDHPNEPKESGWIKVNVAGREYTTSQVFLFYARQFFKETLKLPDVGITLHGDGLLQALAAQKMINPEQVKQRMLMIEPATTIGVMNPRTISTSYADLNQQLHAQNQDYGAGGASYADVVIDMAKAIKASSVLDYGCGKGSLARKLPFPIWEYDPAVEGKDSTARPADLVISTDVLEHVEPEYLDSTLRDLARCVLKVGYFVIHTGPAAKTLPDGRNTHLIQKPPSWWRDKLSEFFAISKIIEKPPLVIAVVYPKRGDDAQVKFKSASVEELPVPKYHGFMRWQTLEKWIKQHNWTHGAELGVRHGQTFLYLLEHCPNLHMTGVDVFESREDCRRESADPQFLPQQESRLREIIAKQYPSRARLIKSLSWEGASQVEDASLDFVFIDAGHEESDVRKDILAWKPKIRPGGMLCGHDLQSRFPGVRAAVEDLCPGFNEHPDFMWSWQC